METIITAITITGAAGLLAAVLLIIAGKVMNVPTDPLVEKIREALPGANCGACGYSGCDGYAAALAKGEAAIDKCPPGGEATYKELGAILGIDATDELVKKIAIVHCVGDTDARIDKMEYVGIDTCVAASGLYGGKHACSFGCLGYGDCVKVCPSGAICISKGIARVDSRKCTACKLCEKVCPTAVISVETKPKHAAVLCKNPEKGGIVRNKCKRGCIACQKCVRECPAKAIHITSPSEALAVIDDAKCDSCGHCSQICITKCILSYEKS
ncbi:MAG: RnfABCDGE type electron transport complex subunit B [Oscillospiraceae bacterium]|nr:RnfABCDGE type electron transport complex subunit B [Oscillospiraceae bacterium]